jgi:hypothetical protein
MKQFLIILIFLQISCRENQPPGLPHKEMQEKASKPDMKLDITIRSQGDNGYTIVWNDTLGNHQKLDKFNRPFHITCEIIDAHNDTVGYYHGFSTPSTWTSYGTKDSIIVIYFSIARNPFSEMPYEQQQEYPDISCTFAPVRLNTRLRLDEKQQIILTVR